MKTLLPVIFLALIQTASFAEPPRPAPTRATDWDYWEKLDPLTDKVKQISKADALRYLEASGRSTKTLLGAWITSGLDGFREELIATAPDDPLAIAMVAAEKNTPPDKGLELARRYQKLAPDNGLPWLIESRILFTTKSDREAIVAIREALKRKPPAAFDHEFIASVTAAYRFAGHSEAESRLCAFSNLSQVQVHAIYESHKGLRKTYTGLQKKDPARSDLMSLSFELSKLIDANGIPTLISRLVKNNIENDLIKAGQPPQWGLGEKHIAELKETRAALRELVQSKKIVAVRDDARILEYIDRSQKDGELAAWQWLKSLK